MAKLVGPLFSLDAHGSVGRAITFSERRSGPQVRFQKKQVDTATPTRLTQRGYFSKAVDWWHKLTPSEQLEWREEGNNP